MSERLAEARPGTTTMAGRLRGAREARGLSQRELAARVSVSPSLISQIEAGQSQPSVNTLYAIVSELDVSLDELFAHRPGTVLDGRPIPIGRAPVVVEEADRPRLRLETGVTWERLASPDAKALDFMEVVYDAGGTSSREGTMMRHSSVECAVVIEGVLDVHVGFDTLRLEAGDSIAFDSTMPHRLWNPGPEPARAIWVLLPR